MIRSHGAAVAAAAALCTISTHPLHAQTQRGAAPAVIALSRGPGHLRTIRVRVGRDTADYLFDTGGGVTVISPQDSAQLGCVIGGKGFGVRLTGEVLAGRKCANVSLGIGPLTVTDDPGVMDLAKLLGPRAPAVRGQVSLKSFAGRQITLDLAHDRLIVETPASLAARVRTMTPVPVRLATGENGGQLTAYVGVRAPNGAMLWFEWDSENNASTLIAPYALAMLGGDTTQRASDVPMSLAAGRDVTVPVLLKKDMVHDGVLSAGLIERAVWSLDLEHGRMWVGPVAPLLELPHDSVARIVPPATDPVGVYESVVMVGGHPQRAVVEITRVNGALAGHSRPLGEDQPIALSDIVMTGNELSYKVMIPNPVPVHLTFDGLKGSGTWGDGGVQRGGAATSIKRR